MRVLNVGRRSLDVRMFGVVLVDHALGFIAVLSRLHLRVNAVVQWSSRALEKAL